MNIALNTPAELTMETKTDARAWVVGTRGSRLALWQAERVSALLAEQGVSTRLEIISTKGDLDQSTPLPKIGDKGLFTAELDAALLEGRIDLAVHSLKDLPTALPDGLVLAAVPERGAPGDAIVARRHTVETTRFVRRRPPRVWDAILVHNDNSVGDLRNVPSIGNAGKYDVEATDHFVLMLRRR